MVHQSVNRHFLDIYYVIEVSQEATGLWLRMEQLGDYGMSWKPGREGAKVEAKGNEGVRAVMILQPPSQPACLCSKD